MLFLVESLVEQMAMPYDESILREDPLEYSC